MTKLLDAWDKKIIAVMEFDYSLSHQDIAHKIKRSKAFVTFRIHRMEESGLIKYQPLIDYSALGCTYYRVIIETLLEKKELLRHIRNTLKAVWLVEKYDQQNFVFVLRARSFGHFQQMWETLYESISPYVLSKDVSLAYRVHHMPLSFLTGNSRDKYYLTGAAEKMEISEAEENLVEILSAYPAASKTELAKMMRISASTLNSLINRLRQKKILLAFQTIINKESLSIRHYKLFLEFDFTQQNKRKIIAILRNHPNVVYITESSYHYDLECEIYCYDDFERIIKEIKDSCSFRRVVISQMKTEEKVS